MPTLGVAVQVEINDKMRGILVDWLVEVHLKFKARWALHVLGAVRSCSSVCSNPLLPPQTRDIRCAPPAAAAAPAWPVLPRLQLMPETLYLTCNIIDRYLSIRNVTRKRLQLVSQGARAARLLQAAALAHVMVC